MTAILLPIVVVLLLPIAVNIATGALPKSLVPYQWIALPIAFALAVPVLVDEYRRHRARAVEVNASDQYPANNAEDNAATGDPGSGSNPLQASDIRLRAVEHLGSDSDVVRVGALKELERLAQANIETRQPTVDIICAFLRSREGDESSRVAQRILMAHISRPDLLLPNEVENFEGNTRVAFWPRIDIDLTGATLDEWNIDRAHIRRAIFTKAKFRGRFLVSYGVFTQRAYFNETIFFKDALFDYAVFECDGNFEYAAFGEGAWFNDTVFNRRAVFHKNRFSGDLTFYETVFRRPIELDAAYVDYSPGHSYHFPPKCRLTNETDENGFRLLRREF
jgi:uncharacterized protein YjbI with pentapeptide repeats